MSGPKPAGLFGDAYKAEAKNILSSRFLIPPFTVLNTREGEWQARKRQWISLGIKSELGRGYTEEGTAYGTSLGKSGELNAKYRDASPGGSPRPAMNQKGHVKGQPIMRGDGHGRPLDATPADDPIGGTSVFDPVLCELVYRWFAPPGGRVLDPFSGGSVRGILAGELGLHYSGIDLSSRQIAANREQATALGTSPTPTWFNGDSEALLVKWPGVVKKFDLIFSCPPYGDLEVYSDDPNDLSNMPVDQFQDKYCSIIKHSCAMLKDGGFACFVVGDYRDKDGFYQNLPAVTIMAFEDCGVRLYNYAILINAVGSLPLRINKQFNGSRKLGKTHQDVLIFAKGQPKDFVKAWPPLDVTT